jgi:hypothetical protein
VPAEGSDTADPMNAEKILIALQKLRLLRHAALKEGYQYLHRGGAT